MGRLVLEEQVAPDTPSSDKIVVYPKAGGGLYKKDDAGVERRLDLAKLFSLDTAEDITIASGIAAATGNVSHLSIGSQTGSGTSDALDKITGFSENDIVLIKPAADDETIVIQPGGFFKMEIQFSMNSQYDRWMGICIGSNIFVELLRINNGV